MTAPRARRRGPWASLAVARLAAREAFEERVTLAGRCAFLVLILLVFSRLWEAVAQAGGLAAGEARAFLWYLAVTEWIALAAPHAHLELERDVRTGGVAAHLVRPLAWPALRVAEAAGTLAARLLVLAPTAFGAAWILGGGPPPDARGLLLALPLGLLAGAALVVFHAAIGVAAWWLPDCSAVHWVWQKLCFVLGGLMLPLSVYPRWLADLAAWTPFEPLLHGPGSQAIAFAPGAAALTALRLAGWTTLGILALAALHRRGLRVLDAGGGA